MYNSGIKTLNAGSYANLPQQDIRLSGNHRLTNTQQNLGIMASAPGTYTQNRKRQMAAGGGIMGSNNGSMLVAPTADGSRPGYAWYDFITDLIPNEIKDPIAKVIPNELKNPLVAAVAANYLPKAFGADTILGQLGENYPGIFGDESLIGRGIEAGKEIFEPVTSGIGSIIKGPDDEFQLSDILGIPGRGIEALGNIFPESLTKGTSQDPSILRQIANIGIPLEAGRRAFDYQKQYLADQPEFAMDDTGITFQTAQEAMDDPNLRFKPKLEDTQLAASGGRIGYAGGGNFESYKDYLEQIPNNDKLLELYAAGDMAAVIKELKRRGIDTDDQYAQGGRIGYADGTPNMPKVDTENILKKLEKFIKEREGYEDAIFRSERIDAQEGGLMDLGGMEKDYRQEGGFVPIGGKEKADDVPARLSKNEFVFTADAVRAAGEGDIDKGASIMERLMDNLEAGGKVSEESQGLEGAREMFANTQKLQNRII